MTINPLIHCTNCRRPRNRLPLPPPALRRCLLFASHLVFEKSKIEPEFPGIWPYRHSFPLPAGSPVISLGEGNTPLEWREISGRRVAFKLEYQNPTGSFKDRGAAVLLSLLRSRGIETAVEDSSGNAGAAFAAYASAAGVKARVFIPDSTSAPKRMQIEKHGAQVVRIMGPRSNASDAVLREAAQGISYASHAYLPQAVAGYATAAFESVEQMEGTPGTVLTPVGQGNLLLGMMLGYQALQHAGFTDRMPVPVGVQALACAPVWAVRRYGISGLGWVTESPTVAEGVRVRFPVRGDTVLGMLGEFGGDMVAVDEKDILQETTSWLIWGFPVSPHQRLSGRRCRISWEKCPIQSWFC
jgi:threonine synthase